MQDKIDNENMAKSSPLCAAWIEVCQGPDCTGLGGGAAILEIEELVQEHNCEQSSTQLVTVVEGACRNKCTVGPNVRIHVQQSSKQRVVMESLSAVKDALSCSDIVTRTIAYLPDSTTTSTTTSTNTTVTSSIQQMLARKAERTRWEALRDVARFIATAKRKKSNNNNLHKLQESCHNRITAASTISSSSERHQRRMKRLTEIASMRLQKIYQNDNNNNDESDSNSSSSMSDNKN